MLHWNLIEQNRKKKKLTIKDVCLTVGISEAAYHYTKSGKGEMNYITFINICLTVGISEIKLKNKQT